MKKSTVAVSLAGKVHPITGEPIEPIGIVNGRVVWPIMGGADADDDDDDDQDDDEDSDDEDEDEDDDQDDDGDDDEDLTPAQQRAVERAANRIADRRINQALRRRNRRSRRDDDDDDDRRDRGRGRDRERRDDRDREDDTSAADNREARLVYRESVPDHIVVTKAERPVAQDLSRALIAQHISDGLDPVDAGEQAAEDVARHLKRLRSSVRNETVRRLQREGHLPKDFEFKSQPKRGRRKPGSQEPNMKTGQAIADSLYADRIKQDDK